MTTPVSNLLLGRLQKISVPFEYPVEIKKTPYPFFVVDDVLPESVLNKINSHWPDRDSFTPEIEHNYICNLTSSMVWPTDRIEFWRDFCRNFGATMAQQTIGAFLPWLTHRYKIDPEIFYAHVSLMESDPTYAGHGCHTHHYHDPCWVGTLLLYLDEASGYPGTTVHAHVDTDLTIQAIAAANTLHWQYDPNIVEFETVAYKQNRLFAFMDGPISYHSVKSANPLLVKGSRRIFRIHLKVKDDWVQKLYDVPHDKYRIRRRVPTVDPQVIGWLKRDIEQMSLT